MTMDIPSWKKCLSELPLGELYLYEQIGSTNQVAEKLILDGAPPFSLVLADYQTAGQGRHGRSWETRAGAALAFSLIVYPKPEWISPETLGKLSGLGALAVAEVLSENYQLPAEIKWPNDVLVNGKKVCGVLVDVLWTGNHLKGAVIGIGINVSSGSVPEEKNLNFPTDSLEGAAGKEISRLELLVRVLESLLKWYPELPSRFLTTAWQGKLAYQNKTVILKIGEDLIDRGQLLGLTEEGALILLSESGEERKYWNGEIQLRLVDRS
jgi:BirA family biotin operon repressor/biotin-[acetyl-CoA-carboxylase] ligase